MKLKEANDRMDDLERKINYIGGTLKRTVESRFLKLLWGFIILVVWLVILTTYVILKI